MEKASSSKRFYLNNNLRGVISWNNYLFISNAVKIPNVATSDEIRIKPSWHRKPLQVLINLTDPPFPKIIQTCGNI